MTLTIQQVFNTLTSWEMSPVSMAEPLSESLSSSSSSLESESELEAESESLSEPQASELEGRANSRVRDNGEVGTGIGATGVVIGCTHRPLISSIRAFRMVDSQENLACSRFCIQCDLEC